MEKSCSERQRKQPRAAVATVAHNDFRRFLSRGAGLTTVWDGSVGYRKQSRTSIVGRDCSICRALTTDAQVFIVFVYLPRGQDILMTGDTDRKFATAESSLMARVSTWSTFDEKEVWSEQAQTGPAFDRDWLDNCQESICPEAA